MKKISFLVLALVMVLTMSACEANLIGIGGADGPTAILVREKKDDKQYRSEKEPVRAIMAGGSIYYDTGEDNDMQGRCGTLDGSFLGTVDKWELPKKDNEANFELKSKDYCGYQIGLTEGTIEVPIGDDWKIFKKIDEPDRDLTKYKYILKVEGDTQYKHGESEYIVLTNDLDITANDVAKSGFSSDSNDHLDVYIVATDFD